MSVDIALGKLNKLENEKPPGGHGGHEIWNAATRTVKAWLDDRRTTPLRLLRAKAVKSARAVSDCTALAKSDPATRLGASCDPDILDAIRNIYIQPTDEQRAGVAPWPEKPTFPNVKKWISPLAMFGLTLSKSEQLREFAEEANPVDGEGNPVEAFLAEQNEEADADNLDAIPGEGTAEENPLIPNQGFGLGDLAGDGEDGEDDRAVTEAQAEEDMEQALDEEMEQLHEDHDDGQGGGPPEELLQRVEEVHELNLGRGARERRPKDNRYPSERTP